MDTDGNQQEHRVLQIDVEGHAASRTVAWCDLAAAVARCSRQKVRQFANLAERGIDGQCEEAGSFLQRVVHIFYHAIGALAGLQTSITQSRLCPVRDNRDSTKGYGSQKGKGFAALPVLSGVRPFY